MPTDIQGLLALLEEHRLRYVIVGGLALVLHGVDRLTADVDLAVDLAPEAVESFVNTLTQAGYRPMAPVDPTQLADPRSRETWHRERNMQVFSFWDSTGRRPTIDVFVSPPIAFEQLWRDAVRVDIAAGLQVPVASVEAMSEISDHPPEGWGSFEDAVELRRWAFRQRTPAQRLAWLVKTLEIAYRTGALKARGPESERFTPPA